MKKIFSVILLMCVMLLPAPVALAQEKEPGVFSIRSYPYGVSLLMDEKGKIIVPPGIYESIEKIKGAEDLFGVRDPNAKENDRLDQWGEPFDTQTALMDKNGDLVTDFFLDPPFMIKRLPSGDIIFDYFEKGGVMNSDYEIIIEAEYDRIISNGYAGYIAWRYGEKCLYRLSRTGDCTTVDLGIGGDVSSFAMLGDFYDNRCMVEIIKDEKEFYGYINPDGAWAIEPRFTEADRFRRGYATVKEEGGEYGLIDMDGRWVLEPIYSGIERYHPEIDEVFRAYITGERRPRPELRDKNAWYFIEGSFEEQTDIHIEKSSKVTIHGPYIAVFDFLENSGVFDGKLYHVDGRLLDVEFRKNYIYFLEEVAGKPTRYYWQKSGVTTESLRDVAGNVIRIDDGIFMGEGMSALREKVDEVDGNGLYVVYRHLDADDGEEQDEKVKRYGIIDDEGNMRIQAIYDWIYPLGEGCFNVGKGDEWGAINSQGEWIVKLVGSDVVYSMGSEE